MHENQIKIFADILKNHPYYDIFSGKNFCKFFLEIHAILVFLK